MSDVKRIGIIGMGMLGKSHAGLVLDHPKAKLCAVCDLYESQTKAFIEAHPDVKGYTDYTAMLKEEKLDIVIVATQDPYHKDPLLAAIGAGIKEIICEKPLTTTIADADEVKKAAEAAGASIYLCFMLRMSPFNRAFRTLVKGGFLGKTLHGEFVNDDSIHVPTKYWGDKSADWAKSSSPIQFLFSHTIDCLRYFFSPAEVTKVYALGKKEGTGSVCDYCEALLTWSDGTVIRIKTDWMRKIATLVENYSSFTFEDAGVILRSTDAAGKSLLRVDFNEKEKMDAAANALETAGYTLHLEYSPKAFAKYAILMYPEENNSQLRSFPASAYILNYILGDKTYEENIVDLAAGYKQVKVVDAVFSSMELDAPVKVEY
jgi:predicted dehydrogenase